MPDHGAHTGRFSQQPSDDDTPKVRDIFKAPAGAKIRFLQDDGPSLFEVPSFSSNVSTHEPGSLPGCPLCQQPGLVESRADRSPGGPRSAGGATP